jgi:hypothetical protein
VIAGKGLILGSGDQAETVQRKFEAGDQHAMDIFELSTTRWTSSPPRLVNVVHSR